MAPRFAEYRKYAGQNVSGKEVGGSRILRGECVVTECRDLSGDKLLAYTYTVNGRSVVPSSIRAAVKKHASHDQKSHGSWATSNPKQFKERELPKVGDRIGIHLDLNGRESGLGPRVAFSIKGANGNKVNYKLTQAHTTGVEFTDVRPHVDRAGLRSAIKSGSKTPNAAFTGKVKAWFDPGRYTVPDGAVEIDYWVDSKSGKYDETQTGVWYVKDGSGRTFLSASNGAGVGGSNGGRGRTYVWGDVEFGPPSPELSEWLKTRGIGKAQATAAQLRKLKPTVLKHAEHDQKSHGNWSRGKTRLPSTAPYRYNEEAKERWKEAYEWLQNNNPDWWTDYPEGDLPPDAIRDERGWEQIPVGITDYDAFNKYREENPDLPDIWMLSSYLEKQWKQEVKEAISLNKISVEDAKNRYGEYRIEPESGSQWVELPETLYHASAYMREINDSGTLLTRNEAAGKKGLGGGPSSTVSLTASREVASNIAVTLREANYALNLSPQDMYNRIKEQSGSWWPTVEDRYKGGTGKTGVPTTLKDQWDLFRIFLAVRELKTGRENPLFFAVDPEIIKAYDPNNIGYVTVSPSVQGAKGWQLPSLGEWRIPTGEAIKVIDSYVSKHAEHDQKTHGRRRGSREGDPFDTDLDVNLYEPDVPKTLYHAAPKSARSDILANGLDPQDQTHNTGAGIGDVFRDEHLWTVDDLGEEFAYEYRPVGVYFFQTLEGAKRYAGDSLDVYEIDTGEMAGEVVRDPSVAVNWDYIDDNDRTYVARYVEPEALKLVEL